MKKCLNFSAIGLCSRLQLLFQGSCGIDSEHKFELAKKQYPKISATLAVIILLVTLTAPVAGGYVVYHTFSDEKVNMALRWLATIVIMLTRLIFSNFTLTELGQAGLNKAYAYKSEQNDALNRESRLIRYKDTLTKVSPKFFQPESIFDGTIQALFMTSSQNKGM